MITRGEKNNLKWNLQVVDVGIGMITVMVACYEGRVIAR
jgi:hypothetical protein